MTTTVVLAARVAASTAARVAADVLDRVMILVVALLVDSKIKLLLLMNENVKMSNDDD